MSEDHGLEVSDAEQAQQAWREIREDQDFWAVGVNTGIVMTIDAGAEVAHAVDYGLRGAYGRLISDGDPFEMSLYGDILDLSDDDDVREVFAADKWLVRPTGRDLDLLWAERLRAEGTLVKDEIRVTTPEGDLVARPYVDKGYRGITVDIVDPEDPDRIDRLSLTEVVGPEVRDQYPTSAHTFSYSDTTDEAVRVDARTSGDVRRAVPVPDQSDVGVWLDEDVQGNLAALRRGLRLR